MIRFSLLLAATWMVAATAYAEKDDPKDLYERATAAFALQNYEEAATLYERSFANKPDPALLYNAAQAHRMGGNKPRALGLYQNYLKLYGSRISNRAEVERHILQLKAAIASDTTASTSPPTMPHPVAPEPTEPRTIPEPEATTPPPPAPAVTVVLTTNPPPPADKPVWKKGWFWGVVVGAVVVVGVGVGLGVGLGTSHPHDPSATLGTFGAN